MTNINFKLRNGELKKIDAEDGLTLMEVARDNDLGIEGCLLYTSPSPRD